MAQQGCGSETLRLVFDGFRRAITFAFRQSLRILLLLAQLLKKRSTQSHAFSRKCLMSSIIIWMSFRPVALPFFRALIPASISVSLKGLCIVLHCILFSSNRPEYPVTELIIKYKNNTHK